MNKKSYGIFFVFIVLSILFYGCSINTIKVKIIDSTNGSVISNTDVKIYSDNGIRCVQAPCPTDGKSWFGKSDNNGFIYVPRNIINTVMTITADGYSGGKVFQKDSEKIFNNKWTISLDPDWKLLERYSPETISRLCEWRPEQCTRICNTGYYYDDSTTTCILYSKQTTELNVTGNCCFAPFKSLGQCEFACK